MLQEKTSYKAWYGQKLDLFYLQILGCTAHLHVPKETRKKLDSHIKRCILVGYNGTNIYKLWDPKKSMVIRGQDVVFDKKIQQLDPPTTIELEEPEVIINSLLTTHLQASLTETAMATNFSPTTDINQVGAQPATDKLMNWRNKYHNWYNNCCKHHNHYNNCYKHHNQYNNCYNNLNNQQKALFPCKQCLHKKKKYNM